MKLKHFALVFLIFISLLNAQTKKNNNNKNGIKTNNTNYTNKDNTIKDTTQKVLINPKVYNNPFDFEENEMIDTMYAYYKFEKGDTLEYLIHSADSITIDFEEPLLKLRYERIVVVCDSVGKNNHFYLTYFLKNFIGKENKGAVKNVERMESNWQNKRVFLEIDSLGNRYNNYVIDSNEVSITPGGSFQPHLFFPIGYAKKQLNETWISNNNYKIAENGFPLSNIKETTLFRMKGEKDTINLFSTQIDYVRTGNANMTFFTKNSTFVNSCVINSHGNLFISNEFRKPVFLYVTIELKLKFSNSNGETKIGSQNTNTAFTLFYYNKNNNSLNK